MNAEYVEVQTGGAVKGRTGSLTALPIIETQAGDVSAFVPTNVISITDGQIFLETDRFNSGIRPAMSPGISVSQYRELAAFAQFASDLDETTRKQLEHGHRIEELMKQKQYQPMSVAEMGTVLFAATEGYLADVEVEKVLDFEAALLSYMASEHADFMAEVNQTGAYNDEVVATLRTAIQHFKSSSTW